MSVIGLENLTEEDGKVKEALCRVGFSKSSCWGPMVEQGNQRYSNILLVRHSTKKDELTPLLHLSNLIYLPYSNSLSSKNFVTVKFCVKISNKELPYDRRDESKMLKIYIIWYLMNVR